MYRVTDNQHVTDNALTHVSCADELNNIINKLIITVSLTWMYNLSQKTQHNFFPRFLPPVIYTTKKTKRFLLAGLEV